MKQLKPKSCRICKSKFAPFSSLSVVCSPKCAIEKTNSDNIRLAKREKTARHRENRERKKEFYANDLSKQLKLTQKSFNKLRVLQELAWFKSRGLEPECISCGKTNMDWCCSHLKTVGSHGELRFDEKNTKLACNRYCNMALSGNINGNKTTRGYLVGLAERFGKSEAGEIIDYCNTNKVRKWTCEELIDMRKEFNKQIRLIDKGDKQ